jgi:holo-[acyl-carrier protein] synthase
MIIGIGIDIVQINRMERWLNNEKLLERFFHPDELIAISTGKKQFTADTMLHRGSVPALQRNSAAQTLAARFAAKEAFGKALGTGLAHIALKDILVFNKDNGKPEIKLFETAQRAFEKAGAAKVHVSLSHEKENAIAMIVLEA